MPAARTGNRPGGTCYRTSLIRHRVGSPPRAVSESATRTWRNGRRKGLKIPWEISREGSSPSVRTNKINGFVIYVFSVCQLAASGDHLRSGLSILGGGGSNVM